MTETPQGLNPAWKPLLDALPEPLHVVVAPHLKEWDKNFQDKLQEVRTEYSGFEDFKKSGIDPENIKRSLYLYDQFANNPAEVIKEAIEAYELPYVDKDSIVQPESELDELELEMSGDITKHPQFAELMSQVAELKKTTTEQQEQSELQAAIQQHEEWLKSKQDEVGEFDTEYVTALMSQGVDGEEAIKRYQSKFAAQVVNGTEQEKEKPPVVMGGDGNSGSGLPDNSIDFAKMPKGTFEDSVVAMLQASQEQNNQG